MSNELNVSMLKKITEEDKAANVVFKSFLDRKRDRRTTDLRQYHGRLAKAGVTLNMHEVVGVFKKLEDAGAGSLILSRGGKPLRFRWDYSLKSIGKVATGTQGNNVIRLVTGVKGRRKRVDVQPKAPTPITEKVPSKIVAIFSLRNGQKIQLTLPGDFNKEDAEKLADFIKDLPDA